MVGALSLSLACLALLWAPPDDPPPASSTELTPWMRSRLGVHPHTSWSVRTHRDARGGQVLVVREHWRGVPIAGASLALRVTAQGSLRQVVGTSVPVALRLPASPSLRTCDPSLRWWPSEERLELARLETSPLTWTAAGPRRETRLVAVEDGRVLATTNTVDDASLEIAGWRENPVSTPDPELFGVPVTDADPITLQSDRVRVVQCVWKDGACELEIFPIPLGPEDFSTPPPGIEDVEAHTDPHDRWVGPQVFQYASRTIDRYIAWGWDPMVWDVLDCAWQEVAPEQCQLHLWVNVLRNSPEGPLPYDGANNVSGIGVFLGQGTRADAGFDMQLVAHEIMHHVQRGYGEPEPTPHVDDGAFWRNDRAAINEGTSDLFARLVGESDDLYGYFRNQLGVYAGSFTRDVSIPFRCPQNIVGEVHMEGRIWASAWYDVHIALQDAGLAGPDTFPTLFIAALPAVVHIPAENPTQFADATAIVLDEIELTLGEGARQLAEEIVDERGLRSCGYVIDLHEEPSVTGVGDLDDPFHARMLMFSAPATEDDPAGWTEHPFAPPVQHRVQLGDDEGEITLRFVPDLWDRTSLEGDPFDGEDLAFAALIKQGDQPILFARDPDSGVVDNDAQRRVLAQLDDHADPTSRRIRIDQLEPGATYHIALVSISPTSGGMRPAMQAMRWSIESTPASATETDTGGPTADDPPGGCGCNDDRPTHSGGLWIPLMWLVSRARRRHS